MRKFYFPFTRSIYLPVRQFFPPASILCPGCYSPGFEFLRVYTKRAELVFAYMGIRGNDTHIMMSSSPLHLITPPPPLCPLSSAAVVRSAAAPYESNTGARRARPGSRALLRISLFGAPKRRPSKNERWAEHRSWMAAARWVSTTMNRTMASSAGGGFDRRRGRGGTCGEDVYASFWAAI
jgi:hypothetical protein